MKDNPGAKAFFGAYVEKKLGKQSVLNIRLESWAVEAKTNYFNNLKVQDSEWLIKSCNVYNLKFL